MTTEQEINRQNVAAMRARLITTLNELSYAIDELDTPHPFQATMWRWLDEGMEILKMADGDERARDEVRCPHAVWDIPL